jgi:hypothetical protein
MMMVGVAVIVIMLIIMALFVVVLIVAVVSAAAKLIYGKRKMSYKYLLALIDHICLQHFSPIFITIAFLKPGKYE